MNETPRAMHVERTDDPAVLRWVCHDERLVAAPPGVRRVPDASPLGTLVADGSLTEIAVRRGDVLVRADSDNAWSTLAPIVRDALSAELDAVDALSEHWLLVAVDAAAVPPTIADIQRLVDRSAGAITAMHGGSMTVTAVESDTVRLRADGACDGCRQSDDTALAVIGPAIRSEFPQLTDIVVESGGSGEPDVPGRSNSMPSWVPFVRRR